MSIGKTFKQCFSRYILAVSLLSVGHVGSAMATAFGMFAASPLTLHSVKTTSSGIMFTVDIGFKLEPGDSMSSYSMSVEFDTDLGDELDVVGVSQPASVTASGAGVTGGPLTSTGSPAIIDSTSGTKGTITSFAGATTPGTGIVNGGSADVDVIIGTITFVANSALSTDGPDGYVGFFDPADHNNFDDGSPHTHITFGDLAVDLSGSSGSVTAPSSSVWGLGILSLVLLIAGIKRMNKTII